MYRRTIALAALLAATTAFAYASLPVGVVAPRFNAPASLGGKVYTFNLGDELRRGPVVLYFYPAAFTPGCTIEAHTFAAAMPQFAALHASVIGVSHDQITTLQRFSVSACRSKFPVAADPAQRIARMYKAVLPQHPTFDNRTSYVIAPDGKILATLTDLSHPQQHVQNALAVLRRWEKTHPVR